MAEAADLVRQNIVARNLKDVTIAVPDNGMTTIFRKGDIVVRMSLNEHNLQQFVISRDGAGASHVVPLVGNAEDRDIAAAADIVFALVDSME